MNDDPCMSCGSSRNTPAPGQCLHRESHRAVWKEEARIGALIEVIADWADHDSWRCFSSRYPDECLCGLNEALIKAGLPARIPRSGSR